MQGKSCLTLKQFIVKKMSFAINESFSFGQNATINISPEFTRRMRKVDENSAIINLGFFINNDNNDMPFSMEIDIEGLFDLEGWEKPDQLKIMVSNTIAILFPYLRTLVSTITASANISPYILPVMNINSLFDGKQVLNDDE
jgi:preprotein translocase subunit SecB